MSKPENNPTTPYVGLAGINVRDQDAAIAFYTDVLGFEVTFDLNEDGHRWVTLAQPNSQHGLMLMSIADVPDWKPSPNPVYIMTIPNFEATCQDLQRRGIPFRETPFRHWCGWCAQLEDPDGNVINLYSEV